MRKNSHDKILKEEPKEQHLSIIPKSYTFSYSHPQLSQAMASNLTSLCDLVVVFPQKPHFQYRFRFGHQYQKLGAMWSDDPFGVRVWIHIVGRGLKMKCETQRILSLSLLPRRHHLLLLLYYDILLLVVGVLCALKKIDIIF